MIYTTIIKSIPILLSGFSQTSPTYWTFSSSWDVEISKTCSRSRTHGQTTQLNCVLKLHPSFILYILKKSLSSLFQIWILISTFLVWVILSLPLSKLEDLELLFNMTSKFNTFLFLLVPFSEDNPMILEYCQSSTEWKEKRKLCTSIAQLCQTNN